MAERMTVVVKPTGDQGALTIEDAMRQVLDIFELLAASPSDSDQDVVWRLVEAKTSSPPFTVVAEATPGPGTEVDYQVVDKAAREKKQRLLKDFKEFQGGRIPEAWEESRAQRIVSDLLERLRHDVTVELDGYPDRPPAVTLTRQDADTAVTAFDLLPIQSEGIKDQMGTVEGTLTEVTTWWNKPALVVSEAKRGSKVTCVISEEQRATIAGTFEDVWQHRRVAVRGLIRYGKAGDIKRVDALEVLRRETRVVPDDNIRDGDFTDGLSAAEYLRRLREGDVG